MNKKAKKNNVEVFINRFCNDALSELKSHDRKLRNKLLKGEEIGRTGAFYSNFPKGINIRGNTENAIKWLIFANLCDRYCMWLEHHVEESGKFLDLAMSIKPDSKKFDIAIEMKWVGFQNASGRIYEYGRKGMIDDAIKLHKMDFPHKYLMQFAVLSPDKYQQIDLDATAEVFYGFDKRYFRDGVLNPQPVFNESFPTWDKDSSPRRFTMIVWEIGRREKP